MRAIFYFAKHRLHFKTSETIFNVPRSHRSKKARFKRKKSRRRTRRRGQGGGGHEVGWGHAVVSVAERREMEDGYNQVLLNMCRKFPRIKKHNKKQALEIHQILLDVFSLYDLLKVIVEKCYGQ